MHVHDSRRLTGPNLLLDGPGACLDVALDAPGDPPPAACAAAWRDAVARLLDAVGWGGARRATRAFDGGVSLAFEAPLDGLYAACDVNEAAWAIAWAALAGATAVDATGATGASGASATEAAGAIGDAGAGGGDRVDADPDATIARLRAAIAAEANPPLVALAEAARARWVQCLADPDEVSVGLGSGSRTWPVTAVPDPATVAWPNVHDVPVALVTGTNGKSTTVRLVAAMAAAAGRVAGMATTDWVRVGDDIVDEGDWSGPGGARLALRDRRTEVAVLECARGGLLRRGLAVTRAEVAAITNVAADHLGEFGVATVADLAAAKLVVAKAAARLVLNADDAVLAAASATPAAGKPVTWFSLDPAHPIVRAAVAEGGSAVVRDGDALVRIEGAVGGEATRTVVTKVDAVPIAHGGAARHNVANALCAIAVAHALGLDDDAIRAGLATFARSPDDNPGRLHVLALGGCTVVVDYAHNPHGLRALADVVNALPPGRRIVLLGQAGDRSDDDLRDLAAAAMAMRPDVVVVKELAAMLRGRAMGEVPQVLVAALQGLGMAEGAILRADDEIAGAQRALTLARDGDVVVLPIHKQRGEVMAWLDGLVASAWTPGHTIPP